MYYGCLCSFGREGHVAAECWRTIEMNTLAITHKEIEAFPHTQILISISLQPKKQRLGCKNIGIRKSEFVAKAQLLNI